MINFEKIAKSIPLLSIMMIIAVNALGIRDKPGLQWIQIPIYAVILILLLWALFRKKEVKPNYNRFYFLIAFIIITVVIFVIQIR